MAAVFELPRLVLRGEGVAAEEDVGVGETLKGPRVEPGPCSGVSIKENWSSCGNGRKRKDEGEDAHHRQHVIR